MSALSPAPAPRRSRAQRPGGGGGWSVPALRRSEERLLLTGMAVLTVLAAALRFWRLGHQGFWFDEANTALLVHFSPGRMLGLIPQSESTPPLYYLIAWVWARIFGFTETGLRSLSATCGVLCVPAVFACGRKLFSGRVGLLAAALAAANPLLVWYSQEARSYSLLVLLCALSLLAFAYAAEQATPPRLAAWAVTSVLALATHYYALLAVAPEALWLLWRHRARRQVVVTELLTAAAGVALLPLALGQSSTGNANWIATAPLGRRLGQIVPQFLVGFQRPDGNLLLVLAAAAAAAGLAAVAGGAARAGRAARPGMEPRWGRSALGTASLALGGFAVALLVAAIGFDDILTRNLLPLWPAAALTVAAGLAGWRARPARVLGGVAALVLCAAGAAVALDVDFNRDFQRPDWRQVAALLGPRPAPAASGAAGSSTAARAILVQHYAYLLPLSLYLPGLHRVRRHQVLRVRELDVVSFTDPPSGGFCWWGSACNLWPSQLQSRYAIPGFHAVWARHVLQFSVMRLVADRPSRLTLQIVGRALHTTRIRNDALIVQR